jgi:hypothetical protein
MISNFLININNKLIIYKFNINKINNKIIIKCNKEYITIPIYNNYNGLDYITIPMPLEFIIYDKYIFNPYIIILLINNINVDNELDFFYNLEKKINNKYNLSFLKLSYIKQSYIQNYNINNNILLKIYILKLLFIFCDIHNINILSKDIKKLFDEIKLLKYNIFKNDNEIKYTFLEWKKYINNQNITLKKLEKLHYYYIIDKNNKNIIKINILDINNNIITINNNEKIDFNNYTWFYYYPIIKINNDYLLYTFYINNDLNILILKYLIGYNNNINYNDILYYYNSQKLSDLITLKNINDINLYNIPIDEIDEINIIKKKSFSDSFFKKIVEKYYLNGNKIIEILNILFNNYNYPLKINRHELDDNFDHILYISLYNYKYIFNYNTNIIILEIIPEILNIIPLKLKNLYLNILKVLINILNNNYDIISYNQKYYNDYLHRNIIKLFLFNSSKISIEFFKTIILESSYNNFKSIFSRNLLLYDISYKISWNTLSNKINYLNIFYQNSDLIYYHNKLNKNIITNNIDIKLKKIIENPLEMYKYLKNENDFIKWTYFIIDKLNKLYYIPFNIHNNDIIDIAKMIYLLFNINKQNINEQSYVIFLNFCVNHSHLILNKTRINLKIKEIFNNIRCNINLGYLAKDINLHKNIIEDKCV